MMLVKFCAKSLRLLSVTSFVGVLAACGGDLTKSTSASGSSAQSEPSGQVVASQVSQPLTTSLSQTAEIPLATASAVASAGSFVPASTNQCDDGIDNDGDGLVDWQYDLGCSDAGDTTEVALARSDENGYTTFDLSADSRVVYVSSSEGDDSNDGLSPSRAVASVTKGASLVRDGFPDFLLLKRGDRWRNEHLGRFKSGRSNDERLVVSSYGDSVERPVLEISKHLIDDGGRSINNIALVGLEVYSYKQEPNTADFTGDGTHGLRFVNDPDDNVLIEDNFFNYSKMGFSYGDNIELRRNIIYRAYGVGRCDAEDHSNRNQGVYMSFAENSLIEDNVFDGNGWNESLPQAGNNTSCATIYNHNLYVTNVKELVVRNNLFLRASSMGFKVSSSGSGQVRGLQATNNLFAEGEIGMAMGGNSKASYTHIDSTVSDNVFTDIGRTNPTKRSLSWGMTIENNDNTTYTNNMFVNPLAPANSMAIYMYQDTNRDVTIQNTFVSGYSSSAFRIYEEPRWTNITISDNDFLNDVGNSGSQIVRYTGDIDSSGITWADNEYYSDQPDDDWFRVERKGDFGLAQWITLTGETGASVLTDRPSDAGRNVDSYVGFLGAGTTIGDFAAEARKQSRFNYRAEYEASAVNAYIREGYIP